MAFLNLFICLLSICSVLHVAYANILSNGDNGTIQDTLQSYNWKPRVFILSDILNEPDDSMSLVRYLLYSNEFETKGLCATTSWWLKNTTHPEEMRTIVQAYGDVVNNLNQHVHPKAQYQSAENLLQLVTSGPTVSFHLLPLFLISLENVLLMCLLLSLHLHMR